MKDLQDQLVKKIAELVAKADASDTPLLDVLDRLLNTVSSHLITVNRED